jgi:glyoxylase-like metal-dependent hydrolase (beta-lactamase superfamily II)
VKNLWALPEGRYTVGADKKFIPFDMDKDLMKDRPASLLVEIQPFVVKTSSDLVLLDTGLGYLAPSGQLMLHENMERNAISISEISKVLLSHLHSDHVGGSMTQLDGKLKPSFPKAVYYVQQGEFETAMRGESKSYRRDIIDALYRSGQLELLRGDGHINEHIQYEITGGHTEYHQAFTISNGTETFFFGGDVLPDINQLMHRYAAKYDFDGKHSAAKRREFGERSVKLNSTLLFYHSIRIPFCKVELTSSGFKPLE